MASENDEVRLREARQRFFDAGLLPEGLVSEPILKSWQRCLGQGLDAADVVRVEPLTAAELRERHQRNDLLRHLIRPEIALMRQEAKLTDSVVIITDPQGIVLDAVGSPDFAGKASEVALRPGVRWSEASTGTNAIGTALVEKRPIAVHGAEHFFEPHRVLTCAAAPIFDPYGRLAGILDMSGHASVQHLHALGLVRMAAEQAEHRFFSRGFEGCEVLRFHRERDLLGTSREAVLVFRDGVLIAGNRRALKLMSLDWSALGRTRRDEMFEASRNGELRSAAGELFAADAPPPLRVIGAAHVERFKPGAISETLKPYFVTETQAALRRAARIADAGLPLLIQGETGAGKEVFAREMHRHIERHDKPFVAINCAALPEGLIESELFGYADGAFTGARRQGREGLIQQASGGVLFLDEIGDMPLSLQSRLLRVLQDREVVPLGGGKAISIDFLPVSATHRPLRQLVEEGQFRADLYYRLAQFVIELPALRDLAGRAEIVRALWRQIGAGDRDVTLSPEAEKRLIGYGWPGNFRQLASTLRAMLVLAEPGQVLEIADLPAEVRDEAPRLNASEETLAGLTDAALRTALANAGGNVSKAARALGVDRSTLYRRVLWKGQGSTSRH